MTTSFGPKMKERRKQELSDKNTFFSHCQRLERQFTGRSDK